MVVHRRMKSKALGASLLLAALEMAACGSSVRNDSSRPSTTTGGAVAAGGSASSPTGGRAAGTQAGKSGASTGGASTGGASTGGASTGGASTGGASTGGASTGGVSTGGATAGAPSAGTATVGHAGSAASDCQKDGDGETTLVFINHCARPVSFAGSDIEGGVLAPGAAQCVDIGTATEPLSSKRYWGFSGDDPGAEHHSLAEFTFNSDFNDFDWYNISYVDAFNLPVQIAPLARPSCKTLTCATNFLEGCPEVGKDENANGEVVVCVNIERNDGNNPVARYFETCDDAYAWSGDDQNGDDPSPVRACAGEDWNIVFCPEPP
jgi:hypothetical protein